ncbi:hypothetical protein ACCAA_1040002 [Candidatus Accumulibacter aalborgensis]|uniref:Uncharacterized protein n=1 Tax=Candidatus Accumulibacter aalborgensis TaxID=1860102 RepID=A0A1A8XE55_9PROT|nr:hypothetical protein ACCAA_1040002 [Candidatus Accumulibacter aalborgensis]
MLSLSKHERGFLPPTEVFRMKNPVLEDSPVMQPDAATERALRLFLDRIRANYDMAGARPSLLPCAH